LPAAFAYRLILDCRKRGGAMASNEDENQSGSVDKTGNAATEGKPAYEVGNKKPPKAFCFKPGQTGNPKGRPKGSLSLESKVQKELAKPVKVKKNGKCVTMSKEQIGVMRLVDKFVNGDPKATSIILGLFNKCEKSKADDQVLDDIAMPDEANIKFIVARLQGLIDPTEGG
jgi:hypothetical protein